MRKFYILTLLVCALSIGFASCTKDDLYRPGGPDSELRNGDGENGTDLDGGIVDPESDDDDEPESRRRGG